MTDVNGFGAACPSPQREAVDMVAERSSMMAMSSDAPWPFASLSMISTIASVLNAYFQVLTAQDRLRTAQQNIASAERILNAIRDRFKAGTGTDLLFYVYDAGPGSAGVGPMPWPTAPKP